MPLLNDEVRWYTYERINRALDTENEWEAKELAAGLMMYAAKLEDPWTFNEARRVMNALCDGNEDVRDVLHELLAP